MGTTRPYYGRIIFEIGVKLELLLGFKVYSLLVSAGVASSTLLRVWLLFLLSRSLVAYNEECLGSTILDPKSIARDCECECPIS